MQVVNRNNRRDVWVSLNSNTSSDDTDSLLLFLIINTILPEFKHFKI